MDDATRRLRRLESQRKNRLLYQTEYTRRYRLRHPDRRKRINNVTKLRRRIRLAGREPGPACEVCGRDFAATPQYDHNHATGAFRGWLCSSCNLGLGKFGDSPDLLMAAARYLREHGCAGPDTEK